MDTAGRQWRQAVVDDSRRWLRRTARQPDRGDTPCENTEHVNAAHKYPLGRLGNGHDGRSCRRRHLKCRSARSRYCCQSYFFTSCLPCADVVADRAGDGLFDGRHLLGRQAVGAQQAVDRVGAQAGEELAAGIGPAVLLGAGHVDRAAGRSGRSARAGRRGSSASWSLYFLKLSQNQWGNDGVDSPDGLAERPPAQRGPAAARVVGDDQGEALVLAPAQRAVLPRREWPSTATCSRVDVLVGLQVVHDAAQAPGPGADRAPVIGLEDRVLPLRAYAARTPVFHPSGRSGSMSPYQAVTTPYPRDRMSATGQRAAHCLADCSPRG